MIDIDTLLSSYPRQRPPLGDELERIYVDEYRLNREGRFFIERVGKWMESWLHRQVVRHGQPGRVLEIGAGSLNHLPYETAESYDVVEPFVELFRESDQKHRVSRFFTDLAEVPADARYDRVLSLAVLEHLEKLPQQVARAGLLMADGGIFQAGIPSEGGFLWGAAWRLTTGLSFRMRTGLPYKKLMRHEHINDAWEILGVVRHFFGRVRVTRFPLPLHHLSFYAYIHADRPRVAACREFLAKHG